MSTIEIARPATPTTTERWSLDPRRSVVEFEVEYFWGLTLAHGRFDRYDGSYIVGPDGPAIELSVETASIDTGIRRRDRHLRGEDFFDAVEHPYLRFRSTHVDDAGGGRLHVTGMLSAAGAAVPVSMDASLRSIDGELELDTETAIDFRLFGMSLGPLSSIKPPAMVHVRARLVSASHGATER